MPCSFCQGYLIVMLNQLLVIIYERFLQSDAGTGGKLSDAFVVALYHVLFCTCADY